jgi:hypothetical protein
MIVNGKTIHFTFIVLVVMLVASACWGQENQIVNGEFDAGLDSWQVSEGTGFGVEAVSGAKLSGPNSLKVDVLDASAQKTIMVFQGGFALRRGAPYHLSLKAKAQDYRQIGVLIKEEHEGWENAWQKLIDLTPKVQTFSFDFIHERKDAESATLHFIVRHPSLQLVGEDDSIDVYIDAVSLVQEQPTDPNLAHYPMPPNGTIHAAVWAMLAWSPGRYTASHDMYLGENFGDVDEGTDDAFRGNLVSAFHVIGFPTFGPPYALKPGTTHYWRVDEVNDFHPDSPWLGDVWSFTIRSQP